MASSRAVQFFLYAGVAAAEMLIALAWWWEPQHAMVWAIIAAGVFIIAAFVDYGSRH